MRDGDPGDTADRDDPTALERAEATGPTKQEGDGAHTLGEAETRPGAQRDDRLAIGATVGRYVVTGLLGAGGMGVVYAAHDPELDRKVAIKLLQARPGGSESGGQAWLLREAQAMARLAHPNVVAVYDVGAMPGDRVFVAMELVEGQTLRQWMRLKRRWREVVSVMRAAGAGLAAAHAAGLVHRDFKPDNVIVGLDGRVRVMDFGLARLHRTDEPTPRPSDLQIESKSPLSDHLTGAGKVIGTPAYMAPEIHRGLGADTRADQFAFGVVLYEGLYHARPFDRRDLVAQRAAPPVPPPASGVPAWLERVVLRAIALDPGQRFPTMEALLAALAADPTARRRRVAIGAGLAVACGAAVAGAFALGGGGASELCTGARAELAGVWDPAARAALETAFSAYGLPFVDDAIRGTEKTLDAYASAWVAMRTEACQATRVRGHQSEEVLTVRMQCLDNRRVELATLAGLFAKPDELLVRGAASAALKLSPLSDCADVAALLAPDPLPKDPEARRAVSALQARLAEARAVYSAGRPKDTLALVTAAAADAERLGHRPTLALLHLLIGQTRWVLEGAAKGEPELQQAALVAEASKADEVKVEAMLQLANLATERESFDLARERWQQASAALERLGGHWELGVRVIAAKALLDSRENKFDAAIAAAAEARTLAAQHPESPTYGYALLVEASVLSAATRAEEALAVFQKVLAFQDQIAHNRIEVAVTLQSMSTAEMLLGRADDAIAHSQAALAVNEVIYGRDSAEAARALSTVGAAQAMKGALADALATDLRALELTGKTHGEDDDQYATVLGQVAEVLISLERPAEAVPYLDRALKIQTARLGPGHVQTLTLVLTRCEAERATGKLAAAIATCRQALATGEASLGKDSPILFVFLGRLGGVLHEAKQPREAAALFDRALRLGTSNPADVYFVALADARAQWDAGDHRRAVELATKAKDGYASIGDTASADEAAAWLKQHAR